MDSKKPFYKSIPLWIVVLILLYSALGFFAIPYFAKKQSKEFTINKLNSTLIVEDLAFNPFTFSASATNFSLTDKDSTLWFKATAVDVDVNLWDSVFNNISISKISIDQPFFNLITQSVNKSTVIKYPHIKPTEASTETPNDFNIDIEKVTINKGSISYNDKSGKKQFNLNLKELNFNLQSFTTKDIDSHFDLSLKTDNNDETQLSGIFNYAQLKLDGKWKLKNWTTATIFKFISDTNEQFLGLTEQSGSINANGTILYKDSETDTNKLAIEQLSLSEFKAIHDQNQRLEIPKLQLTNAAIDLIAQSINIEQINTDGNLVDLVFDEEDNLIWNGISENKTSTESEDKSNKWSFSLQQFNDNHSSLATQKPLNNTVNHNTIGIQSLVLKNISNNPSKPIDIVSEFIVNEKGSLTASTQFTKKPFNLHSTITAKEIDVSKYNAWLPQNLKLSIHKGYLSLKQEINILKNTQSKGWVKLNDIELLDHLNQPFLTLSQLDLQQFSLDSEKKTVKLNKIKLDQAQGTLSISSDKKLNLSKIINKKNGVKEKTKETKDEWIIEIDQVEFIDAKTNFIDKSIKPTYQAELAKLNGNIKGLSSSNLSKADVILNGTLDTYGKIAIKGQINPLSDKAYTNLSIDINNLDLQNFSSYSARYLGFPIDRGKADFKLKYKLNQSLLKGINDLTFKQLKFGSKTASKDAVNLPLKLAVSLLTDGKGIMKINMPVNGNIDDPEFSYGGLVFKAFFKLITGIVASPFKLLGKLVPGGAELDLSGVQFLPGQVSLMNGEDEKLKAMQQILNKKKGLILELLSITNTINDSKALKRSKLLSATNRKQDPDFSDTSELRLLKELYLSITSTEDLLALSKKSTLDGELNTELFAENIWADLVKKQNIESEINQLAKQRAQLIQSKLIEEYSIHQDRIFIKQSETSEDKIPQVKFGIAQ